MLFERVALEAIGVTLPPQIISSQEIEQRLSPVYTRLRLPSGRLELMSGIEERRFWPPGTSIAGPSIQSARLAMEAAQVQPSEVGCLIHASVCRDYLEPATACRVHAELNLPSSCWVYDVSNACLGLLNGIVQIAGMIEAGAIQAGIVVGTENARNLLESTIASLNGDASLTRQSIKPSFASLTIGSGSCAILLVDRGRSQTGNQLLNAVARAECQHHNLCQSDTDQAGSGMQPLMQTDSEQLMQAGIRVGAATFEQLLASGVRREKIEHSVCHQVGAAHRRLMLQTLGLPEANDFSTFHWLGNTGSVALPTALALGLHNGFLCKAGEIALLGIGSGINSVMMTARFPQPRVAIELDSAAQQRLSII